MKTVNHAIMAKVRAMYGRRLKRGDYEALMACRSVDEVAKALTQFSSYQSIAAYLTEGTIHRGYFESLLRRQYFNEFLRLYQYLSRTDKKLVSSVVIHYEITEILYCIKEGRTKAGFVNYRNELIDYCSNLDIDALSRAGGHEEVLQALSGSVYEELLRPYLQQDEIRYLDAENVLYSYYYRQSIQLYQKLLPREQRKEIRQLLGIQIDFSNIARVLRLRKYFNLEPGQIVPYLLTPYYRLDDAVLAQLMEGAEDGDWEQVLKGTVYRDILKPHPHPHMEENMDEILEEVTRRLIHFSQNAPTLVLAYLKTKDIEMKNVVTLIESKRYGLSDRETWLHLIGAPNRGEEA